MMKKIKIIFFMLIVLTTVSPFAHAAVKNGVYEDFYANGNLRVRTKYKQGVMIYKKIYFQDGKLSELIVYEGRKRIKSKTYYENGQLKSVWTEKSGETKYYAKDGSLKAVVKDNPSEGLREKLPSSLL